MKRGAGAIRMGVACVLLFAALSLVVYRQSRALEALRALDSVRSERAMLQAERSELQRDIQRLESFTRIVEAAGRLGLHTPSGPDIRVLTIPAEMAPDASAQVAQARYSRAEVR